MPKSLGIAKKRASPLSYFICDSGLCLHFSQKVLDLEIASIRLAELRKLALLPSSGQSISPSVPSEPSSQRSQPDTCQAAQFILACH